MMGVNANTSFMDKCPFFFRRIVFIINATEKRKTRNVPPIVVAKIIIILINKLPADSISNNFVDA